MPSASCSYSPPFSGIQYCILALKTCWVHFLQGTYTLEIKSQMTLYPEPYTLSDAQRTGGPVHSAQGVPSEGVYLQMERQF